MQKIVLFIEPNADKWITPFKIGELFMNKFFFDKKARHSFNIARHNFKIVKIFELVKSSHDLSQCDPEIIANMKENSNCEYQRLKKEQNKKGMNLSTLIYICLSLSVNLRKNPKPGNI